MKKYVQHNRLVWTVILFILFSGLAGFAEGKTISLDLTKEENAWIEAHKNQPLKLGLDPSSGMDYFTYLGQKKGYVIDFIELFSQETGLTIEIVGNKSWSEVYQGLQIEAIDILFGANVTTERLKFMTFTKPIHQYPYAMFALKDSSIMTIGDADSKKIGFIEDDIAIKLIPEIYDRISYETSIYGSQQEAVNALLTHEIDAFITNGGSVADHFLYNYPELKTVAQFRTITSDMTLSTLKDRDVLIGIFNRFIEVHVEEINLMIQKSVYEYNWLILSLTEAEINYIQSLSRPIQVAVSTDYLPFEYIKNDRPGGIFVAYFEKLKDAVGIPIHFVSGDFNALYGQLQSNDVQAMNLAKTEDRKKSFLFTSPFSIERDEIYGYKEMPYVGDIYNLEGKKIAVVEGYYQKDYLEKNLNQVDWIEVNNIKDALQLVNDKKADYVIENPTVVQYYIEELKLYNITKKGETGSDSLLYIAIHNDNKLLLSIINKSMTLLDYDSIKNNALTDVPHIAKDAVAQLGLIIVGLGATIAFAVLYLVRISRKLIDERSKSSILEEKQKLLYLDPMTQLKNRQYYNMIESSLNDLDFPQIYIVIDLNNLKFVNDTHGHFVGDEYIVAFANLLLSSLPERSMVIRMGGDEFLVIVPNCTYDQGKQYIVDIQNAGYESSFYTALKTDKPWASYGLSERLSSETSVIDAIQRADNFMYENKRKERTL